MRDFYLKIMQNLHFMFLSENLIKSIENDAFKDLVSLELLMLHKNMIKTLSEKLYASMIK